MNIKQQLLGRMLDITILKSWFYFEEHTDIRIAIRREKTMKKWKKEWKRNQITERNPEWKDLSLDWGLSNDIKN